MPKKWVLEFSEAILSPSGKYSVSISSTSYSDGGAISQAIIDGQGQGSGLISFQLPRVSMSFEWKNEELLWIGYPENLPTPIINEMNSSFGFGGKCNVEYESVNPEEIRTLEWTQTGELSLESEDKMESGTICKYNDEYGTHYSYHLTTIEMDKSLFQYLSKRGFQCGGDSWGGIVYGLLANAESESCEMVELDPESGGLSIRCDNRESLVEIEGLITKARNDPAKTMKAAKRAIDDGQME